MCPHHLKSQAIDLWGWHSKVGTWDAAAPLGGDPLDLDAPVYMSNSYWPKYEKNVTVSFRNYDDTGDDVLPKKEMTPGDTLTIPAAPDKANEYSRVGRSKKMQLIQQRFLMFLKIIIQIFV